MLIRIKKDLQELQNIIDAVYFTRDLINEPFSHLTAQDLANAAKIPGKDTVLKLLYLIKRRSSH